MSASTFPAVCLRSTVPLVFPIWETCLLSFGPRCSCQCKSGRTLRPIDTDLTRVYYTRANVWGKLLWIANQKLQTCLLCKLCVVLKHTWECYYWTNQGLTAQLANPWKYMLCLKKRRDILDLKHDPYGSLFPPLGKKTFCFCHSKENPIYNLKFQIIRLLSQNFTWGMLRFWLTDSSFW